MLDTATEFAPDLCYTETVDLSVNRPTFYADIILDFINLEMLSYGENELGNVGVCFY